MIRWISESSPRFKTGSLLLMSIFIERDASIIPMYPVKANRKKTKKRKKKTGLPVAIAHASNRISSEIAVRRFDLII